ncbi:hypothetical protein Tco_1321012 [Tanacetum coccineum]
MGLGVARRWVLGVIVIVYGIFWRCLQWTGDVSYRLLPERKRGDSCAIALFSIYCASMLRLREARLGVAEADGIAVMLMRMSIELDMELLTGDE